MGCWTDGSSLLFNVNRATHDLTRSWSVTTLVGMNLHLLRDFAEAYAMYTRPADSEDLPDPNVVAAINMAKAAIAIRGFYTAVELEAFFRAQHMLDGELAAEDRPMVERLRLNAAVRFARKLALLPPTEKT